MSIHSGPTPAIDVAEMPGSGRTMLWRVAGYALGLLLLLVPTLVAWQTSIDAGEAARQRGAQGAADHNRHVFELVNRQSVLQDMLDERLGRVVEAIGDEVVACGGADLRAAIGTATERVMARPEMRSVGVMAYHVAPIGDIRVRWVASEPVGVFPAGYVDWERDGWSRGLASESGRFMHLLLANALHGLGAHLPGLRLPNDAEMRLLADCFMRRTGAKIVHHDLWGRYCGRSFPGEVDGQPCTWFWLPIAPRRLDAINAALVEPARDSERARVLPPDLATPPLIVGGIFVAVPPAILAGAAPAQALLTNMADTGTALALLPLDGSGSRALSPEWQYGVLARWLLDDTRPAERAGWVVSSGTVLLNREYRVFAASRGAGVTGDGSGGGRGALPIALALALLVGCCILTLTVFTDAGLTRSLALQLIGGFLLSALLPLAVVDRVAALWLADLRVSATTQARREITNKIDAIEQGLLTYRPWMFARLQAIARSPALRRAVDASLAEFRDPARRELNGVATRDLINRLTAVASYEHSYWDPLQLYKMTVAAPGGYQVEARPVIHAGTGDGSLGDVLATIGSERIELLNPAVLDSLPASLSQSVTALAKREMVTQSGLRLVLSMYGADTMLTTLNGWGAPMIMGSGVGAHAAVAVPSPGASAPEFVVTYIMRLDQSDLAAAQRVCRKQGGRLPVAFKRWEWPGLPPNPAGILYGMPGFRQTAQLVRQRSGPVSMRGSVGATGYLFEGRPAHFGNLLLWIGVGPEAPLDAAAAALRHTVTGLLLLAFATTILLGASTARDLLAPVRDLGRAMDAIDHGDYAWRLPAGRQDEFGDLCRSFNTMARGLEERELLSRMVSAAARKAVDADASGTGASGGGATTELRSMTVLFLGIPGFDAALARWSPAELMTALNHQSAAVCAEIMRQGGDVDKLLGDKILAVFYHEGRDAGAAVRAAVTAGRNLLAAAAAGDLPFPLAAGIHSGSVLIGLLGAGERRDHTVIGDTVNMAARIEVVAEEVSRGPKLVVSAEAWATMGDDHPAAVRLPVTAVKGKRKPVSLLQIVAS